MSTAVKLQQSGVTSLLKALTGLDGPPRIPVSLLLHPCQSLYAAAMLQLNTDAGVGKPYVWQSLKIWEANQA